MQTPAKTHLKTLLFYLAACTLSYACDNTSTGEAEQGLNQSSEKSSAPNEDRSAAIADGGYQDTLRILGQLPTFSLVDQRGEPTTSSDFYGKVWVANFIFTQCTDTCPRQTSSMARIQERLKSSKFWQDIEFASISVDPENDTPQVLSEYIRDKNLDVSKWKFLTGSRESVWRLIEDGFKLPVAANEKNIAMPIIHSSHFVLIDWEGRIRNYYDSLTTTEVDALIRDIEIVGAERVLEPADVASPAWIDVRAKIQARSAEGFKVFKDFRFSDKTDDSNITFRHKGVDDGGRNYKAVHYDHGNAIAVADIDLDGLSDIYFTTQAGSNELWRNLGGGKFEDITKKAGLKVDDRIGVGASFADIDNDGDQDLYTTSVRLGNQLFENNGKGEFKNITESSGTGIKAHSSGSIFFDYDRDGLLDLFVTNVGVYTTDTLSDVSLYTDKGQVISDYTYYVGFTDAFAGHLKPERSEESVLLKNMGNNRFKNVTNETGLIDKNWTGDASVIDGNQDGWPDLYVVNMQGHDEYYENVEGKKFVRKSREVFPKTSWGAMGIKSFDFDNDGDMDIYITDMHSDMAENVLGTKETLKMEKQYPESFLKSGGNSIFGNAFYRNDGENTYAEVSDSIGAETYWPWGLSSGDLNSDGFEDVFITSGMNYPFRYAINFLLLNNRGENLVESQYLLGVEPRKGGKTAAPWFELLCSGRDATHPKCAGAVGRKVHWAALSSRSSVIIDIDQDGDQDIVTLEFNQPPMVLLSNLSEKTQLNFVKIQLVGGKSNKNGIGAKVQVFAGEDMYTKMNDGKSGYLSQSVYPLYFGLGNHKKIDKVEVSWPSGQRQQIVNPKNLNKLLVITEP